MARHDDTTGNDDGGRANRQGSSRAAGAHLANSHAARGGCRSADRHRSNPSRPLPDRLPVDTRDRLAFPAAGDRRVRPRAGRARHPSRLVAAAAAVFPLATLGGYLLSVWIGLFGFTEVRTTAG